ncbi:hypothetical protein DAETH_43870 (plasmid) [Deinococcus aetherius]|uniref:Uncharacterized protein n=1 Tax=Deinococcus aetherius TaxID=200252 RepID=A0ABM8AKR6_9DEIO|nr:hypothetical protein DAETH_43870 [Deinococcus aetherius]
MGTWGTADDRARLTFFAGSSVGAVLGPPHDSGQQVRREGLQGIEAPTTRTACARRVLAS